MRCVSARDGYHEMWASRCSSVLPDLCTASPILNSPTPISAVRPQIQISTHTFQLPLSRQRPGRPCCFALNPLHPNLDIRSNRHTHRLHPRIGIQPPGQSPYLHQRRTRSKPHPPHYLRLPTTQRTRAQRRRRCNLHLLARKQDL